MNENDRRTDAASAALPLAKEIPARLGWEDLFFSTEVRKKLEGIVHRWKARGGVLQNWGFARRVKSQGIVAMFAGNSGTGKTEAASVIASSLGLKLFQVNAAALLSKYIGETEKNISAILGAAEDRREEIALVFDEGETIFSKRVDAKGSGELAHNSQVGLLLSRVERFNGLAILTTNKPGSIDEAFKRRFQIWIEFETPGREEAAQILKLCLAQAPLARDVDLSKVVALSRNALAGGSLQNIALSAGYIAHARGLDCIDQAALREAFREELTKLNEFSAAGE